MPDRKSFVLFQGLILPVGAILSAFMVLGNYGRLLGDDYCSIYIGGRLGLFRSVWYWYINWHGGFSASVMDWFLSATGAQFLRYDVFLFLFAWLIILFFVFKKVLSIVTTAKIIFLVPLVFASLQIVVILLMSPDLSQSLFWWGGVRAYLSPLIWNALYVLLFLEFIRWTPDRIHFIIWCSVSFLLSFISGGFSEVFTPVQVVAFVGASFISWWMGGFKFKDRVFAFLVAGLVGACLSLIVMVLAPGNANRQEYFSASPGVIDILTIGIKGYFDFLRSVFAAPALAAGLICLTLGAFWAGMNFIQTNHVASSQNLQWAFAAFGAGFILVFGCFLPSAYGISDVPPPRTLIIPSYFLATGFLAFGFLTGRFFSSRSINSSAFSMTLVILCWLMILPSSAHLFKYIADVREEHVSFAEKWDRMDSQVKTASEAGESQVLIPSMANWAGVEFPNDNPKYWPNICYSKYYGINVLSFPLDSSQE